MGSLADVSYSENLKFAIPFLAVAALILLPTASWIIGIIRSVHVGQEPPGVGSEQSGEREPPVTRDLKS